MRTLQRVVWFEGMLVSPQHMQQADLYHERLLHNRLAAYDPFGWGVAAMEIDLGALAADQFRLNRFAGILPDGLFVELDAGDRECPPARTIQSKFPPTQPTLDVYVAVPKEREGVPSVEMGRGGHAGGPARTRYLAVTRPVGDMTGDSPDLDMSFAQRNVVVLFGDESREDYDSIKVAEIVRSGGGTLVVNETYIPPLLRIENSPFLMAGVRRLLSLLVAKQRQLADERKQRDGAAVEFNANDVTRFLQLNTMNTAVPLLTHLTHGGQMTPHDFYVALVQTAGQLATFAVDEDPSKFPLFQFADLRATFEELFARLTALLHTTAAQAVLPVVLELTQGIYLGKLSEEQVNGCAQFVLAVRTEMGEAEVAQRLPSFCKIASYNQLPYILRAATPGVPVRHVARPPAEVPLRPGVVYFLLETQSEHWKQVQVDRSVGIHLPPPFDAARVKLELFGIPRRG